MIYKNLHWPQYNRPFCPCFLILLDLHLAVFARVPEDAGLIGIKFITNKGKFLYNGNKEITASADSISEGYRYAKAFLVSDTVTGRAYVSSEYNAIRRVININFVK